MTSKFWKLPEDDSIEITAPVTILSLLGNNIVLSDCPPANGIAFRLEWDSFCYQQCYNDYWNPSYKPDEIVYCENDHLWMVLGFGFVLIYSKTDGKAFFYIEASLTKDLLIYSYPLLNLLTFILKKRGYAPLHAAVIGDCNRFVLVPGKSATGKSTTSATWALHGGQFITDDLCFANPAEPFKVYGFYPTIRLREESLPLINHLLPRSWSTKRATSKYFFSLLAQLPAQCKAEGRVDAIFCLTISGKKASHSLAPAKMGFEYLASSVAFSLHHNVDSSLCLQVIKKLTRDLPVFQVNLSGNADENYFYLKDLISSL